MSVFEQLRPFVSLFQACGMIPFTVEIEHNSITNKFAKFTFSFRHFTTWWFFIVLIADIVLMVVLGSLSFHESLDLLMVQNMPITVTILIFVTGMSYSVQLFLSRSIVLYHRKLRNAIEAIQVVEKLFGEKFIAAQNKNSVTNQFVFGFILVISSAIGTLVISIPMYQNFPSLKDLNILLATTVFFFFALLYVLFECTFFFFYICYYIITYYVQILIIRIEVEDQRTSWRKTKQSLEMMRKNVLIFNYVCRASQELNNIFSVPVLILLTAKFISVVTSAFADIYNSFIRSNVVLDSYTWTFRFMFFTDWVKILVLLTAADMPVDKVRLLRDRVTTIYSGLSQSLAGKISIMTSLVQIDEERVRLSAAGLFKVGMHLIPSLVGAVVTYMVILLQN